MDFALRDGIIWMDGEFMDWKDVKIHVLSHGLHYASSVFEGERVYDGQLFKGQEHHERLIKSAAILGFELPYIAEEITDIVNEVVRRNGLENAYVRPVAWRGSSDLKVGVSDNKDIHFAIAAWEWPNYFNAEKQEKGIKLQLADWRRPDPKTAPTEAKTAALYAVATLAKNKSVAAGFDDALMLDWRGYVAEATAANFFMVKDDVLITPTAESILNGITRQTVMAMAKDMGYKVEERHITLEEVWQADEIFVTGTAAEVTLVGQIAEHTFAIGLVGKRMKEAYTKLVHK